MLWLCSSLHMVHDILRQLSKEQRPVAAPLLQNLRPYSVHDSSNGPPFAPAMVTFQSFILPLSRCHELSVSVTYHEVSVTP